MQVLGIGQTKHVRSHLYLFGTLGEIHIHSGQIRISLQSHQIHFGSTMLPLFPSFNSHFSQVVISTLLFLFLSCCISSLGKRAYSTMVQYQQSSVTPVVLDYQGDPCVQGKLCLRGIPRTSSAVSTRHPTSQHPGEYKVTSLQNLRPTREFLQTHLQEPEIFLGLQVTSFLRDPSCHIKTPM